MPKLNGEAHLTGVPSIVGMKEWLAELGHSVITSGVPVTELR
jgi:folylpolyglutamate synthase